MTDNLTLRIVLIAAWAAVALFMASGAYTTASKRGVRRGDPMRLACFVTAVIFIGYSVRAIVAPASDWCWQALHLASIADAMFIIALGRAYGRGDHV